MAKLADIVGKRFGKVIVLERDPENGKSRGSRWFCKCDCGDIKSISYTTLKKYAETISCGCGKRVDLKGKRFGRLVVMDRDVPFRTASKLNTKWICKCDCGEIKSIFHSNLMSGETVSCGCKNGKHENLIGERFERLVVIAIGEPAIMPNGKKQLQWLCVCDCGQFTLQTTGNLKGKRAKSCGCYKKENPPKKTHGQAGKRLYKIWQGMIQRCTNKNHTQWHDYGGRGIRICTEWLTFEPFYRWSMENGYEDHLTIDRIENNKGYNPLNCRWADMFVQAKNKRSNTYFYYKGEQLILADISRKYGVPMSALSTRIYQFKWSIEKAVETPVKDKKKFNHDKRKKVLATNLETGEKIIFESIKEAGEITGAGHVSAVILGKRKSSKGFFFEEYSE
ncbi:hypothetical protein J7E81_19825 [Bacillus sp. ISL-18]|uniref:hypothetical protein n=1 Tax=Bacillus sp. ISL-18 TaxID=2819118 RepID=UPI001BEAC238|nr:hypothetical protein [Bacillus sp. ISL-18]MBT2657451.1 hypothetical protein [Bacillus sp. ISL-18]